MREKDHGYEEIRKLASQLARSRTSVVVGVVEGKGGEDIVSDGLTMAGLAAVQEFGATIDHPGGTPYVVTDRGAVFVKKDSEAGQKAISAGRVTGPHKITVPERAPIRTTFDSEGRIIEQAMVRELKSVVDGKKDVDQALNTVGLFAASRIRRTIQRGLPPPNAPSTIRKKKSSKPLIGESGALLNSYTHQVRNNQS